MNSYADVFACFDDSWPDVAEEGFEGVDSWTRLGAIPGGAGIERPFWEAVSLQAVGGGRARWKADVDFYADVVLDSPAYPHLSEGDTSSPQPFWLGLHAFAGTRRLYVSSVPVTRAKPAHRFQRHPGLPARAGSTVLGFRLKLAGDGSYFQVARP